MPTVEQNITMWGKRYHWVDAGEEWSLQWGGASKQWQGTIRPRIARFLPARSVLEIAPGYGRFTQFLETECTELIGVDVNDNCVDFCKHRFAGSERTRFIVNDGRSLAMIPDASIDLIFSFDSLVHADVDVIESYLSQFGRILRPNGVAFLHHSNYAHYAAGPILRTLTKNSLVRRLAWKTRAFGLYPNYHWRSETVSAAIVNEICRRYELRCISQELVNWGVDFLSDCFSTITKRDSAANAIDTRMIENTNFMLEAATIRGIEKPPVRW